MERIENDGRSFDVVVTPRSRVASPLSAADIRAIVARDPRALGGEDPLVIARVEYFLHGSVFILALVVSS